MGGFVEAAGTVLVVLTPTNRQPLETFLRSRGSTMAAGGAVGLGPNPTP